MPKTEAVRQRLIREADFAFKQAFAFCPYSPEAVFRYVQLLVYLNRIDDALLVAETWKELDPYNQQPQELIDQLSPGKRADAVSQIQQEIAQLEAALRTNPNDVQKIFDLATRYFQVGRGDRSIQLLDKLMSQPNVTPTIIFTIAEFYHETRNLPKLEATLEELVKRAPNEPEAWYNLAATKAQLGKVQEAVPSLKKAIELSDLRLLQMTNAIDLRAAARQESRFEPLRGLPEYKALFP